jgi:DNA-binding response OmpR family regulator
MKPEPLKLLVVEDDAATCTFLADNLTADGYEVDTADSKHEALRRLERWPPELAIVDVNLGDGSGLDLLRAIRESDGIVGRIDPQLPVIVVSGLGQELDRVRGLMRGADDYLPKPFSYLELLERVRAVLRRSGPRVRLGRLRVGELEVDPGAREVRLRGRRIDLSAKEFALLRALAAEPTRVFTKEELLREVWGFRSAGVTRTLDSHACRLRRKLGVEGDTFVLNVWGVGYRLVDTVLAR